MRHVYDLLREQLKHFDKARSANYYLRSRQVRLSTRTSRTPTKQRRKSFPWQLLVWILKLKKIFAVAVKLQLRTSHFISSLRWRYLQHTAIPKCEDCWENIAVSEFNQIFPTIVIILLYNYLLFRNKQDAHTKYCVWSRQVWQIN